MTEELINNLSDSEREEIEKEIAHLPNRAGAAIDALKIVQEHRGWVSDESIQAIARLLDMSAEELDSIATFYNLIFRRPVGENVILFCESVSCWICDCDKVREKIENKLGIKPGETTADNRYTLLPVPCLGACDRAPVMLVGKELHTNLDEASVDQILVGDQNG